MKTALVVLVAGLISRGPEGPAAEPGPGANPRPWPALYKIKPSEIDRLTPADVVGPDGIVYPNWTRCGVQGGIPASKPFTAIEAHGGRANDDGDDAPALDRACQAAGESGGGTVALGEGVYHLDRPVTVRHSAVVIRGQGASKTRLVFRYALPRAGIAFFWPPPNSRVGRNTRLELHAKPSGLARMRILIEDRELASWSRGQHSGNTFAFAGSARGAITQIPDGPRLLQGIAEYSDGTRLTAQIPVLLDSKFNDTRQLPDARGAITFAGEGLEGPELKLARDGHRGDLILQLEDARGLRPGDAIMIEGPATDRWKKLTANACLWGTYRRYETVIEKIDGAAVTLDQPLRIEFPVIDGSYVQKVSPIQRCGVEDLCIEQTENLWISSVLFAHAWNCWARGVTVRMCGRFPVYGSQAKWCEIRDCLFDDAWFKGGGGTAYTGWDGCWDCLMENVETRKMRHAPLFQWAASGNVIRKSLFRESDGQWHAGWCNENLFEQCRIESVADHGAYGFGMWASPPNDAAHGPNGPRNVVYNCDVTSPKTGLWMGGMNENWLVLHNRFVVERGQGVHAGIASFDHIIHGNVFVLKDSQSPMLNLSKTNCVGIELRDNRLYGGSGRIASGPVQPLVMEGNQVFPLADAPRPRPPVPSIYEWQATLKKSGRNIH
ncbi:MAG TPA: endopolygalacturonase [Candidatus Paceibacterota bacterium]|nr:endopolygalacturonase [Verrucomicrobiota bacterium]HOX03577.1 endopolygalacturonase [Verrucomicrobiota bacterium]HRZ46543.1 endopolygalacturonase [Candidatus Paceibacterota bacterium]